MTSLVITHDMHSAYRISDRIAMLYDGRVLEEGTPDEIRELAQPDRAGLRRGAAGAGGIGGGQRGG